MKLSAYAQGRDNNFNLIRMVAAFSVLLTHCFALVGGSRESEPLLSMLGMTIGDIAVDMFFVTSGFLITASLLSRKSMIDFIWARMLRIYPALIVALVLSAFILGPYFTTLPLSGYFLDPDTWFYLMRGLLPFIGFSFLLPGVFEGNPYAGVVNGSLWTITFEVLMYALLAIFWIMVGWGRRSFRKTDATGREKNVWVPLMHLPGLRVVWMKRVVLAYLLPVGVYVLAARWFEFEMVRFFPLSFMFFTGAAFYLFRERIHLSSALFGVALAILIFSLFHDSVPFSLVYSIVLAYCIFYVAYVPVGSIRQYNRLGDYSYGVYVYAFPLQQALVALIPNISIWQLMLLSSVMVVLLAVLSWHFLEKKALALKMAFADRTRVFLQDNLLLASGTKGWWMFMLSGLALSVFIYVEVPVQDMF